MRNAVLASLAWALAAAACGGGDSEGAGDVTLAGSAGAAFDPATWMPPADSQIPTDSLGGSIRRGLALIAHTPDSLPYYAPGKITCSNCHLDFGRNPTAAPFAGSAARFPKYMDRTGAVIGLADRVNYCFTRSLAGRRLPVESREMQDILAYITWLSSGVPVGMGKHLPGADGIPPFDKLEGDTTRGAAVFQTKCIACHGADGQGLPTFPALWGPRSFSVGASMARIDKASSFIWHNMPFGQGKSLTKQEATDVAAYVTSRPRLDSPGKEQDWPTGGAPEAVPYATHGHEAFRPPPLLPRADPAATIVPKPVPAPRRSGS
jgi:thiosulfate dehydrogenase